MTNETIAHRVIDPLIGGADDVLSMAVALVERAKQMGLSLTITTKPRTDAPAMGNFDVVVDVQIRREPHHGPHHMLTPVYSPEMQALFLQQLKWSQKNRDDNDAMVGRRRRWSNVGGAR